MILKLNIKELAGTSTPASPSFTAGTAYLSNLNIKLTIGGLFVYEGLSNNLTGNYVYDDTNPYQFVKSYNSQILRLTECRNASGDASQLSIIIPQLDIQDKILIEFEIYETDGNVVAYNQYKNSFYVYGYDTTINIIMKKDSDNFTFPSAFVIDKPFSNYIEIYKDSNLQDFESYEINETIYSSQNSLILLEEPLTDIKINCNTIDYTISDYERKTYLPVIQNTTDANFESENTFNVIDGNKIITYINYQNVSIFKQNTLDIFPCKYLKLNQSILNQGNILETNIQFITKNTDDLVLTETIEYTLINSVENTDLNVNINLEIFGDIELINSGELEAGEYYMYSYGDNTKPALNDVTITGYSLRNGRLYVTISVGGTPTNWEESEVILSKPIYINDLVYSESLISDDVYRITDVVSGSDYSVNEFALGSFPVQGENHIGLSKAISIVTINNILNINGILPYNITKEGCNKILIQNYSYSYPITVNVYPMLDNGDISNTSIVTGTINVYDNETNREILELNSDNVYKILIIINDIEFEHYVIISCNFETCLLKYLNELICCDTTNCDTNIDCRCVEKNYYDFNAFSTLMHTAIALMNEIYIDSDMFRFLIDNTEIQDKIKKLHNIRTILFRAEEYCLDCQKINSTYSPCKSC